MSIMISPHMGRFDACRIKGDFITIGGLAEKALSFNLGRAIRPEAS
ncbi:MULTISPECIES: hypothetical protein [unclassified Carboxydocella]|nr:MULTISPECIES: hypothetical protein [unclassified Carboxydocella]